LDIVTQGKTEKEVKEKMADPINYYLAEICAETPKVENPEIAEKQRLLIKEKSALASLDELTVVEAAKTHVKIKKQIHNGTSRLNCLRHRTNKKS
jgi:hypothetical protein